MIRELFKNIDSLEFYDTTNYDYQVLKAYINNDSAFFDAMAKGIKTSKKQRRFDDQIDSCFQLKKISELLADEVYRFSHGESFCFFSQRVTISKKGDSVLLHYLEYSASPDGKVIELRNKSGLNRIGPGCRIEKEYYKLLSKNDWEVLKNGLEKSDYWGLRSHNLRSGLDGSSWEVYAYKKQPNYLTGQQVHSVYRWSPENSFKELGLLFMKLAGEKGMCGEEIN